MSVSFYMGLYTKIDEQRDFYFETFSIFRSSSKSIFIQNLKFVCFFEVLFLSEKCIHNPIAFPFG